MLKKAVSLLFLLAILFAFSGCDNVFFSSADNLMRPPKISGDINSALRTEFEKSIGGSYALKYPASGEYQSPYIMYDLDKDGQDEAVVFYSLEKDNTSARMALFDYTDDKWNLVSDIKGLGNSINSVSFEDMGNNGRIRLVVSWGFFDTKTANILAVYSLSSTGENKVDTVQQMFSEPYAAMKIFDVDGDGVKEIFLITDIAANDTVKNVGRLFTVRPDGSIAQIGAVTMDSTVSGYSSVKLEPAAGDKPYRIFVDAKKGDISMSTEVIYWDKKINGLSSPLLDVDTQSVTSTVRNTRIESRDINGDGILEIPLQMSMKNDVSSPYYDVGFISSGDSGKSTEPQSFTSQNGAILQQTANLFRLPIRQLTPMTITVLILRLNG